MKRPGGETRFEIRRAIIEDIPVLAGHRAAMFRDMGHLTPTAEAPLIRATTAYLRTAMPGGEYLAWVAQSAALPREVIGGAGVQLRTILPRPGYTDHELELGPEAIVLNVYVLPEWRRRGVAESLMRALLGALAERKVRRIVLHASDQGRRLYERLGFEATNEMRLKTT